MKSYAIYPIVNLKPGDFAVIETLSGGMYKIHLEASETDVHKIIVSRLDDDRSSERVSSRLSYLAMRPPLTVPAEGGKTTTLIKNIYA